MTNFRYFTNKLLNKFGYKISKSNTTDELIKIYKYKNYKEYKKIQIQHNKEKIKHIFSDENTLDGISEYLIKNMSQTNYNGICHGSRNGFEVQFFNNKLVNSKIIGTDISENVTDFKNSIIHDFHQEKKDWISYFDFVYSNSLDQSYDPKKALQVWLGQIKINGYLFVELTNLHTVQTSGSMDPFGVEIPYFPYLVVEWFGSKVSIQIIKNVKSNKNRERKVDMNKVIKGASFVAEGLISYVFAIKKLHD